MSEPSNSPTRWMRGTRLPQNSLPKRFGSTRLVALEMQKTHIHKMREGKRAAADQIARVKLEDT